MVIISCKVNLLFLRLTAAGPFNDTTINANDSFRFQKSELLDRADDSTCSGFSSGIEFITADATFKASNALSNQ